jgi:Protein of unknown function (DUF1592)/Protein of unknown function (DUF1588)/Protein of unknown function (DUF1585)
MRKHLLAPLAFALLVACSDSDPGNRSGGKNGDGTDDKGLFTCDGAAKPDELALPRLSRAELESTLRFAITLANPQDAEAIWKSIGDAFARYPEDLRTPAPGDLKGGYDRGDQAIQQTQIDAIYDIAIAIGKELTATPARTEAMLGACATDSATDNDRACLEGFIAKWAARIMRAPLDAEDLAFYADIAGNKPVDRAAVADVIGAILNAPQTLYRVEHGTDGSKETAPLSSYELAARLSYQFWQAPPDDELWKAAEERALLDEAGYRTQVERLVRGPELRSSLDDFIAQWLRLDELAPLDVLKNDPVFKAFAGAEMPPDSGRAQMIDDVLLSAFTMVSEGGSVSDFLNDKHAYAKDGYLASIYRVPVWDGTGPAPLFTSDKRAGLLTRAALLSTGTPTTRPIHKGYVIRNAFLCQQVGTPPPNVNSKPPTPKDLQTTRQAVADLTSSGACAGCHLTRINPPGFLTENFDALGRERTEERVFDAQGKQIGSLPVDTSAAPAVQPSDAREMSNATELTRAVDESKLFHSCLARHYFRFTQRRTEAPDKDGCLLSEIEHKARSGAPMAEVLSSVALAPAFKVRRFQ